MELVKILIADSQMLTREGITSVLKNTGYYDITGYIESDNELFDFLKNNTPSILIIDPYRWNDFLISHLAKLTGIFPASRMPLLFYWLSSGRYRSGVYFLKGGYERG